MIKNLLFAALFLLFGFQIFAQTQFENPGFEEWEDIPNGDIPEPVDWSSARSAEPDGLAELAPVVWGQSMDAHSGNYSVYLINVPIFTVVAPGTITNGRIHADLDAQSAYVFTDTADARWNTPFDKTPDSIVGWYKANPMAGDFATVRVILHKGYASMPQADSSSWIALASANLSTSAVTSWTRFSIPFQYFSDETPEYMLAVLTAGDGLNAVAGSEAWFDDLEFTYYYVSVNELAEEQLSVYYANGFLNVTFENQRTAFLCF